MTNVSPRLNWFIKARFGLFVHYGLFSLLGRGEWVLSREQIPLEEYAELSAQFTAENFDAQAICALAVRAGMRYIVFTSMHHDGFRLYETALSDFNSVKAAAGRDLVAEVIQAARSRGLRIGLYHSLNNWYDQPDAVAVLEEPQVYETFIKNVHERVRELVTKYNPIDILWYDGWWPFDAKGWRAQEMNNMVSTIQPHILFNGRNGLHGDFATPEQHFSPPSPWRPLEVCFPINNSWGYHRGDRDWKRPSDIIDMLAKVAQNKGNLLLNIGPRGDGSFSGPEVMVLDTVGKWIKRCGESIFETDTFTYDLHERGTYRGDWSHHGRFTARRNNLYLLVQRWSGTRLTICGLECLVKRVTLLNSGQELSFGQKEGRVMVESLPELPPDPVCSVIKFECDRPPSMYLCGGLWVPKVEHPHYDPCKSDLPI